MKIRHAAFAATLTAALAGAGLTGAHAQTSSGGKEGNPPDVEKRVDQAYDTMKDYSYAKKQEFLQWADARTAALDRQIATLRKDVANADAQAGMGLKKEMHELEQQRKVLGTKTEELRRSSAQAWSDVKWGFAAAVDSLEQSYAKASARFKEEQAAQKGHK